MGIDVNEKILKGSVDAIDLVKSKTVCLFLSSTFNDFYEERNYLLQHVYPELREFCKNEYRLDFQVVDLRWGVEEFGNKFNLASDFCMNEVKRCYETSVPCFVALIGDRFGGNYLPSKIAEYEFLLLKNEMQEDSLKMIHENSGFETDDIIDHCYKIDENVKRIDGQVEYFYKLLDNQSISSLEYEPVKIDMKNILYEYDNEGQIHLFDTLIRTTSKTLLENARKKWIAKGTSEEIADAWLAKIRDEYLLKDINAVINEFDKIINDSTISQVEKIYLLFNRVLLEFYSKEWKERVVEGDYHSTEDKHAFAIKAMFFCRNNSSPFIKSIIAFIEWLLKFYNQMVNKKCLFMFLWFIMQRSDNDYEKDINLLKRKINEKVQEYDEKIKTKTKSEKSLWRTIEAKLIDLFQKAALKCLEKGFINKIEHDKYFYSVTGQEIYEGILSKKEPWKTSLVFIRSFNNLEKHIGKNIKLAKKFIDVNNDGSIKKPIKEHLSQLKDVLIPTVYNLHQDANLIQLEPIDWDERKGVNQQRHADYFKTLGNMFRDKVKKLITEAPNSQSEASDGLLEEIQVHSRFAQRLISRFQERHELIDSIISYVEKSDSYPLVLHGQSGCGKSSLLAKVTSEVLKKGDYTVLLRFLGTTSSSSTISKVFRSIIRQLDYLILFKSEHLNLPTSRDDDSIELGRLLIDRLNTYHDLCPNETVLILLDSLDQLPTHDHSLSWFIKEYPSRTRVVLSVASECANIIENLKVKGLKDEHFLSVDSLDYATACKLFDSFMDRERRVFTNKQQRVAVEKLLLKNKHLDPLYVKLIFDITYDWCSFTAIPDAFEQCTDADKTIEFIFKSIEDDHGQLVVSRCLFYLTLGGISDAEMEDVMSLNDDVLESLFKKQDSTTVRRFPITLWNRIKLRLNEYLVLKEVDGTQVYSWYHRRFMHAAHRRYIDSLENEQKNSLILIMLCLYCDVANGRQIEEYSKRLVSIQPLKFNNGEYNGRKINRTIELIMKFDKSIARNQLLVEQVFLNYEFIAAALRCDHFNVSTYCPPFDYMSEFMNLITFSTDTTRYGNDHLSVAATLVQHVFMSLGDSLNRYPDSVSTQLCSRINCLAGMSEHFTKFINDSLPHCCLVATCPLLPLTSAETKVQHEFFKPPIIDYQHYSCEKYSRQAYLGKNLICVYNWSAETSRIVREIELPNDDYRILRLFKYQNEDSFGYIAATVTSIRCFNDDGHEIYRPKIGETDTIKDIIIVRDRAFLVCYENRSYIDIFYLKAENDSSAVHRETFKSSITSVVSSSNRYTGFLDGVFLAIFLDNSSMFIYQAYLITDREVPHMQQTIFQFKCVYSYSFSAESSQIISAAFDIRPEETFRFIVATQAQPTKLFSIEYNSKFEFSLHSVETVVPAVEVLNYCQQVAILVDTENTHLYHTGKRQWLTLPGVYKYATAYCDNKNDFYRVELATEHYLDIYLIQFNESDYKIVKILNKRQFTDEIFFTNLYGGKTTVQLKSGCLLKVDINSIVLSQVQNEYFQCADDTINFIVPLKNANQVLTCSLGTQQVLKWDLDERQRIVNSSFRSTFRRNGVVRYYLFKSWLVLCGRDDANVTKLTFINRLADDDDGISSILLDGESTRMKITLCEDDRVALIARVVDNENTVLVERAIISGTEWTMTGNRKQFEMQTYIKPESKYDFCVTSLSDYLIIASENRLMYISMQTADICYNIELSATCKMIQLKPIANSDNIIAIGDKQCLLHFTLTPENNLVTKVFHEIRQVLLEGELLILIDKHDDKESLVIYNLGSMQKELYKRTLQLDYVKYMALTPDCQYLAVFSERAKLLELHKITKNSVSLVAQLPVLSLVTCLSATNSYVTLGIGDNRLLSYLIVDSDPQKRLKEVVKRNLKSRITIDGLNLCLNATTQMLVNYNTHSFSWNTIFHNNEDNKEAPLLLVEYLVERDDIFDCLLDIYKQESYTRVFNAQFQNAKKIIQKKAKIEKYISIEVHTE